jgi:hypothetical protein
MTLLSHMLIHADLRVFDDEGMAHEWLGEPQAMPQMQTLH